MTRDLIPLNNWAKEWTMKFSAKSCSMCFKCNIFAWRIKIGSHLISISNKVREFGLKYSCSFNFLKRVILEVTKANKIIWWLHKTLIFVTSLINVYSCISALHFRNQTSYSPRNTNLFITTDIRRTSIRLRFLLLSSRTC